MPSAAISATVASFVTTSGPASRALRIRTFRLIHHFRASQWCPILGLGISVLTHPPREPLRIQPPRLDPGPLASEAVAAIVVAINSLRVFIDARLPTGDKRAIEFYSPFT